VKIAYRYVLEATKIYAALFEANDISVIDLERVEITTTKLAFYQRGMYEIYDIALTKMKMSLKIP